MAQVSMPAAAGTAGIKSGALPRLMAEVRERWSPEAMYFTTFDGRRTAYIVFDMPDSSSMPPFSEPFFQELEAEVQIAPVMNGDDLQQGLSALG